MSPLSVTTSGTGAASARDASLDVTAITTIHSVPRSSICLKFSKKARSENKNTTNLEKNAVNSTNHDLQKFDTRQQKFHHHADQSEA